METVIKAAKDFEQILLEHDPAFQKVKDAIKIVKKFIADNKLIIYGGTAIDYALRLEGDFIYSDAALLIPDLDFYSPDAVNHSYQLADILFDAGYLLARAICGRHIDTMRVDMEDNHFIADIHHIPQEIFDKIPYITYENMRIVHPHFQFIDLHSSLAFPYDDPPTEVIFARWKKDIERFNKLYNKYPVKQEPEKIKMQTISIKGINRYVWNGFLAYALLYSKYTGSKDGIVPAEFTATADEVKFTGTRVELIHIKPTKCVAEMGAELKERYEAYAGMLPSRCEATKDGVPIDIYSSHNRLISINSVEVSRGVFVRAVGVQYLLRYFAILGALHAKTPLGIEAWRRYTSILEMISRMNYTEADIGKSPFLLSINIYGGHNISHSTQVSIRKAYATIHGDDFPLLPKSYVSADALVVEMKKIHPPFNYEISSLFCARGRPLSLAQHEDKDEDPEPANN